MIRKIITFFYEYKSLNHLLFILLLTMSYFSYQKLAKEMFPPASLETIVISGGYFGSNSELLDNLIVKDCEEILSNISALTNINTSIKKGNYSISAELKPYNSKILVINDIKSQLEQLDSDLPSDMKLPIVYGVENYFPLLSISIFSQESEYKKNVTMIQELNDKIKKLHNIHQSEIVGKLTKTLRIMLDFEKVEAYGLNKNQALSAITELFKIYPIGKIESKTEQYFVSTKTTKLSKEYIQNLSVKIDNKSVQLKEIANIKYIYEKHSLGTRTDAKPSIIIMTKKAKMGDSIKLSHDIRKILGEFKKSHPNTEFKILSDSSFWIKTRLNVIGSNIIIGLILLFLAVWLFISFRISLVVIVGIPVSLAFGVIGLDFFHSGLNTLSMIGVLLSLGLLVDEAIVVSENIHRHSRLGKSMKDSCIDGTLEVLPALFIALLTTIIAFLPLLFISGGLGVFIKIIPLMVIILITSSFIESFVFLPSHYRMFNKDESIKNISYKDKLWDSFTKSYGLLLNRAVKHKYIFTSILVVSMLFVSFVLVKNSKFILFPEFDAMSINITGLAEFNSLKHTSQSIKPLEKILLEKLDKKSYSSIHTTIGMKTDGRSAHESANNLFTITINLNPKIADDFYNREINPYFRVFGKSINENRVREKTAKMIRTDILLWLDAYKKELELEISIPQTGVVKNDISLSLSSQSNETMSKAIVLLKAKMQSLDGVSSVKDDMLYDDITLELEVNGYGEQLGFTQQNIIQSLTPYLRSEKISKISNKENELLELKLSVYEKNKFEKFEKLSIKLINEDVEVALKEIANIVYKKSLSGIRKENLQKVFSINANLDKKLLSSREFYKAIEPVLQEIKKNGVSVVVKGEAGKNAEVANDITKSILFTLFGILIILTFFFNSLRLALFSLSVIPLSLFGVLLGHKLLGLSLTFSSMLGIVGLIGIVMNDTLIMLDFIRNSRTQEELVNFATTRLKPILLTSITTVLGLFTLMFFASGESLLMQPLAVSIGFGLLGATVINLFYIPVAFSMKFK